MDKPFATYGEYHLCSWPELAFLAYRTGGVLHDREAHDLANGCFEIVYCEELVGSGRGSPLVGRPPSHLADGSLRQEHRCGDTVRANTGRQRHVPNGL